MRSALGRHCAGFGKCCNGKVSQRPRALIDARDHSCVHRKPCTPETKCERGVALESDRQGLLYRSARVYLNGRIEHLCSRDLLVSSTKAVEHLLQGESFQISEPQLAEFRASMP